MSLHPAALSGLLPVVAAGSLILRGLARRRDRRDTADGAALARMIQMPKEPAAPPARGSTGAAAARPAPRPCPDCGNPLDPGETRCLPCRRADHVTSGRSRRETVLHWAVFGAGLAVIGALGWLLA